MYIIYMYMCSEKKRRKNIYAITCTYAKRAQVY